MNFTQSYIPMEWNGMSMKEELNLRLKTKSIYIGKIINNVSYLQILSDRFVFVNLHNPHLDNRYNITLPFNEITAIRYCFGNNLSRIIIQPIIDSYRKLSNWLSRYSEIQMTRFVPENFIMIYLESTLDSVQVAELSKAARECKSDIKMIQINSSLAVAYQSKQNNKSEKTTEIDATEIIQIEDDDEDDNENRENDNDETQTDNKKNTSQQTSSILDKAILKFPENEPKPIILYGKNLNCLRDGQYLNDNILNFYLKYYQYYGKFDTEILEKIYIYDALFSHHLNLVNNRKRKLIHDSNNCTVYTYTQLENTYDSLLKTWTKDIDIFAKDFLLMPLVKDSHWFLIILCYVGNSINKNVVNNQTIMKPTIIYMDSLEYNADRSEINKSILSYLRLELKEKRGLQINPQAFRLQTIHAKVPQQKNYYDCGLFVLEYIERFLKDPENIFIQLSNNNNVLQNWFDPKILYTKRAKIQQIIMNLLRPDHAKELETELMKIQLDDFEQEDCDEFPNRNG